VTITTVNHANTSHGLDSHALRIDMRRFDPVPPGKTLMIRKTVEKPRRLVCDGQSTVVLARSGS
jgi:hypothetical protein